MEYGGISVGGTAIINVPTAYTSLSSSRPVIGVGNLGLFCRRRAEGGEIDVCVERLHYFLPCMVLKLKVRIRSIYERRVHTVFCVYTYMDPFFLNRSINQ